MEAVAQRYRAASLPLSLLSSHADHRDKRTNARPRTVTAATSYGDDAIEGIEGRRFQNVPFTASSRVIAPEYPFNDPRVLTDSHDAIKQYWSGALRRPLAHLSTEEDVHHFQHMTCDETWGGPKCTASATGSDGCENMQQQQQAVEQSSEFETKHPMLHTTREPTNSSVPNISSSHTHVVSAPTDDSAHTVHEIPLLSSALLERYASVEDYDIPGRASLNLLPKNEDGLFDLSTNLRSNSATDIFRPHQSLSPRDAMDSSQSESLDLSDDSSSGSLEFASSSPALSEYHHTSQLPSRPSAPPTHWSSVIQNRTSIVNSIASWRSRHKRLVSKGSNMSVTDDPTEDNDRDTATDGSDESASLDEIEASWHDMRRKRAWVVDIRAQMKSRRKELRRQQRRKDEADNAFMNLVRPLLVNMLNQHEVLPAPINSLERRWADMQKLRDEYHNLESSYEDLELVLHKEEQALNHLEARFFSLLAPGEKGTQASAVPRDEEGRQPPVVLDVPFILSGISPDGPAEALHPLYIELTSAIGDLGNAKEEYQDLCWLKDQYDEEVGLKLRTGQNLPERVQEFLDEFPSEEARMRERINVFQAKVEKLRYLCEEKQVMRKHMSARMLHELDPDSKFEDMDLEDKESILARIKTLAHPRFPELLSQPDHVLAEPTPLTPLGALRQAIRLPESDPQKRVRKRLASKEYAIDSLLQNSSDGGKASFVNRWLLQTLRQCPLNAVLLHTIFVSSRLLRIRDPWRWQCDVLHYWWHDDATICEEETQSAMSSTQSSRLGTPQMSRAASDSYLTYSREHARTKGSDAATVLT